MPPIVAPLQGAALPDPVASPTLTTSQLRLVAGLAAGSVAFGALVLVSWRFGHWGWLALDSGYVPTAPGTGMMAMLLGAALLLQALLPSRHAALRLVAPLALTVLALSIVLAFAEHAGTTLTLEYWFTRVDATRGGVPLGQTALVTSALCATIALGILLRWMGAIPLRWHAALHLVVVIAAMILLQGYLFGGPLLYDRGVIPVAALTAAVILALSIAALVLAGPTHWPMRLFVVGPVEGNTPTVRDARWFVVLLVAFVASSGYFWAVTEGDRLQQLAEGSVVRIALRATALSVLIALGLGAALLAAWSRRDLTAASRELHLVREREQSIEELRRSEERYALAMRGTSDGLWDWDLPSDAVYVSPHWVEMLDLADTSNLTMANDFFGRLHPDDRARAVARLEAHLRDGGPYSQEVRLRHDDGRYLWFWVRGEAVRDASGIPVRMAGAVSGITARREAEDALLLFREVMERSSDAIFLTDAVTGKFLTFNAAAPQWLRYSPDELRTMGPNDIVPQVGGAPGWDIVVARIRAEDSVVWPRTFCRKDGTTFPVEVALTAIETGGREVILTIARDISEREQLMTQLLRSQKMESVGRLAGGVAHDFNNLLTVINATVDLAMPDAPAGTSLQRDLEEIRGASNRAAALTRQLLAFSRQQVLHQEPLAMNDLITGFLKMLRRVIGEDIEVKVKLAPTSPTVLADAGQMEQVLMNLSVNSRDAMPSGGRLTIRTSRAHLDEDDAARHDTMRPGDYALLEVADTGVGMDRKTQAMIFEPFFTTKAQGQGTGLGLSTVYGIIKQMGGGIWVYSEVGVGTTFKIYLPLVESSNATRPALTTSHQLTGTETILIVEDEAAIRTVVRRVLERVGYTVLEADSGDAALALIADHAGPLHLVMTDLVMPGMTGAELAAELRRSRPGIPILLTSGYSVDVVEGKILPGVDCHFISKPYTASELTGEVRRVLDAPEASHPT